MSCFKMCNTCESCKVQMTYLFIVIKFGEGSDDRGVPVLNTIEISS